MTAQPIFDAHHHLWDLEQVHYPWLAAKGVKRFFGDPTPIQQTYRVEDFLADAAGYDVVGSTHIEVGAASDQQLEETRSLEAMAQTAPHLPSAIVAAVSLHSDTVGARLDAQLAASPRLRGVRQIIGRHPDEDAKTGSNALLEDPAFARGLGVLAKRGLSFDLQLTEPQYAAARALFARHDSLKVAICHLASPWDLSAGGFDRWRMMMARFAELPNMYMKLSGFGMFKPDWTGDDIRPWLETALELFGPERCMAGSNFPVDKLYGGYARIWEAIATLGLSAADHLAVTLKTGQAFYRIA